MNTFDEKFAAVMKAIQKVLMWLCIAGCAACFVAGFFKPHAFIMASFYAAISVVLWAAVRKEDKETEEQI